MNIFDKKKTKTHTIIIGCGRLGSNIANTLSNVGENVLIIDENRDSFRRLASNFGGLTITGNGTNFDVLKEAEIDNADVVIAVTNDDNANIMVAQIAREVFKVEKVIARLYDAERESVYKDLGINTICPAILSIKEIDKLLEQPTLQET